MNLKRIITFTRGPRKKIKIQNNKNQIGKHNTIKLNWMMKLKTTKIFTKWSRKKKLKIQKIRTKLENVIFGKLRLKDEIEKNKNSTKG
jgi:hypothetical protein